MIQIPQTTKTAAGSRPHAHTHAIGHGHPQQPGPTSYTMAISKSLTIDEMRELHQRALSEAEAKKTELKLVLASRYRELVGSSDEVLEMRRDANVLDELVAGIPELVDDLIKCTLNNEEVEEGEVKENLDLNATRTSTVKEDNGAVTIFRDRVRLADAPRIVHSCLDHDDVHGAAVALIETFSIISKYTCQYPLANSMAISSNSSASDTIVKSPALETQIKMIYLHLQTIPLRTIQTSKKILLQPSESCGRCPSTARALSALHLLNVKLKQIPDSEQRGNKLMDLYFDSKAKLIQKLLDRLSPASSTVKDVTGMGLSKAKREQNYYTEEATDAAEKTISEILTVLQYDVILYPYHIFSLRKYEQLTPEYLASSSSNEVMDSLPVFDKVQLKAKMSNFLAAHLPMIRAKVKTILVGIAGTTASRLGSIRQSLYDKTDGVECLAALSNASGGICSWEDAIQMIDVKVVMRALEGLTTTNAASSASSNPASSDTSTSVSNISATTNSQQRRFSLWGTLFSNTFSSLVHSILSTSFHSVHRQVVATLRASLANAPPFREILPHEAYRNTLYIATELDKALKKVSDDAHELLVHAEEREESERRLRQSLYVQTCEIMGRLLNELRRMLKVKASGSNEDPMYKNIDEDEEATKELIVGRLCYLLKFRLPTLPTLLDSNSSPAVISSKSGSKVGMITIVELQSAFDIADVDDDGLITFEEAMETMEGAFSGTQFRGTEMVRDTMLLSPGPDTMDVNVNSSVAKNLTISELALLSARGLRHATKGPDSALGTIQIILDNIIDTCFSEWAHIALAPSLKNYSTNLKQFMDTAMSVKNDEWRRLHLMGSTSSEEDFLQKEIGDVLGEDEGGPTSDANVAPELGSVSSFLVTYFISTTTVLNQSISPSDSMVQSFPSTGNASTVDIATGEDHVTLVKLLQTCLLRESLKSLSKCTHSLVIGDGPDDAIESQVDLQKCSSMSLIQLLLNISFILECYFQKNQYNLVEKSSSGDFEDDDIESTNFVIQSEAFIRETEEVISSMLQKFPEVALEDYRPLIKERIKSVFASCGMFLNTLFGEDNATSKSSTIAQPLDTFSTATDNQIPLLMNPLASSRRFMLLPIQAEQSVKELQLIQNLEKERSNKAEAEKASSTSTAASAVSSSFGFFSSMLKKK